MAGLGPRSPSKTKELLGFRSGDRHISQHQQTWLPWWVPQDPGPVPPQDLPLKHGGGWEGYLRLGGSGLESAPGPH